MRTLTQIELAAAMYGGRVGATDEATMLPTVLFGPPSPDCYGIEATECDDSAWETTGDLYGGFRYFGAKEHMHDPAVMACFNFLTLPEVAKEPLTIERAQALMGRTVRLSYCDVNEGEYTIIIDGMVDEPSNGMLGQGPTCNRLHFREVLPDGREEAGTWLYEWQGVFRRGSGAERLFVEEVITDQKIGRSEDQKLKTP